MIEKEVEGMTRYHFDLHGSYRGYLDDAGRYFDTEGVCRGHLVCRSDARRQSLVDPEGNEVGFIDAVGNYYDDKLHYRGFFRR
jgi:hypothetical protein